MIHNVIIHQLFRKKEGETLINKSEINGHLQMCLREFKKLSSYH